MREKKNMDPVACVFARGCITLSFYFLVGFFFLYKKKTGLNWRLRIPLARIGN